MSGFEHQFEWDPKKAVENLRKHGISFETGATIFLDPLARTIPDPDHSETEERWISIGHASNGQMLLVIHTWQDLSPSSARVRIISARPANRAEIHEYEEHQ